MDSNSNMFKCKFTNLDIFDKEHKCRLSNQCITEDICDSCNKFKSKYIEYPIEVNNMIVRSVDYYDKDCGQLVKVRPCDEQYENKTFIGILLGDLPYMNSVMFKDENKELTIYSVSNPAIFVPELKKIIFGMESWWSRVNSIDDIKDITDEDIENTWYVKLLR